MLLCNNMELYNSFTPDRLYLDRGYNNKFRWISYHYQIRLYLDYGIKTALEIGAGNGWTVRILKDMGVDIKTADINHHLKPDYVASVDALPLPDNSFDAVTAFEMLEHLPFDMLASNLKEMGRVASKYVIFSLPDQRRTLLNLQLKVPLVPPIEILIKIPRFSKTPASIDGHYFEIGLTGFPLWKVKKEIKKSGLTLIRSFTTCDGPTSHYFVLKV